MIQTAWLCNLQLMDQGAAGSKTIEMYGQC